MITAEPQWRPDLKAKLVAIGSQTDESEIPMLSFPVVVGRFPGVAVQLDCPYISRNHCEIDTVHGSLVLRDLKSRNGTYVNGSRITECVLYPGDAIQLGPLAFEASYEPKPDRFELTGTTGPLC